MWVTTFLFALLTQVAHLTAVNISKNFSTGNFRANVLNAIFFTISGNVVLLFVNASEKRLQDSLLTEKLLIMMNLIITKN